MIAEGTLNVSLTAGAVTDTAGNPEQAYSTSYTLDVGVGPYGLQLGDTTQWMYRNDAAVRVQQGNVISAWVQASALGTGRTYIGFGASSGGALSMVMGDNTSTLILQNNAAYGFNQLASGRPQRADSLPAFGHRHIPHPGQFARYVRARIRVEPRTSGPGGFQHHAVAGRNGRHTAHQF